MRWVTRAGHLTLCASSTKLSEVGREESLKNEEKSGTWKTSLLQAAGRDCPKVEEMHSTFW